MTTTSASYNYGGYKETGCDHYGITHVMDLGKAAIYAGSRQEMESEYGWKLLVCLLGHNFTPPSSPVKMNEQAGLILPPALVQYDPPALLSIDWPDGSAPPLKKPWWETFFETLKGVEGDVGIFCFGGHGRTGTTLSILAGMAGKTKKGCPVAWVRKQYCNKAVETNAQIKYVEHMSGVKVLSRASGVIQAEKAEAEKKAKEAAAALNPNPPSVITSPPSGRSFGDEFVIDPKTGVLVRKSEQDDFQDWEQSWHRFGG